jgi:hypothetical protein
MNSITIRHKPINQIVYFFRLLTLSPSFTPQNVTLYIFVVLLHRIITLRLEIKVP